MLNSPKKRKSVINLFLPFDELPFPDNRLDQADRLDLLSLYSGDPFGQWVDLDKGVPGWSEISRPSRRVKP